MSEYSDALERLFASEVTPQQVRAIEAGGSSTLLWEKISESGFPDALIPESQGGAGLVLRDVFDVLLLCGRASIPLPLAMTMVARAALADAGAALADGPITVAGPMTQQGGVMSFDRVAYALTSTWVLVPLHDACALIPIARTRIVPVGVHASLEAHLEIEEAVVRAAQFPCTLDWRATCAALVAAQMAGAMQQILENTVQFANERSQFGQRIGKFQAIQQQLSVLAEQVFAARMAAELACAGERYYPDPLGAAIAKARVSEAVVVVAGISHAVHGAIGIAEECDLQLLTRRLHEFRLAFGAESYWNRKIGRMVLESTARGSVDFVRERMSAAQH